MKEGKEERKEKVFNYTKLEKAVTIREIKELLNVGFITAERILNNLVMEGKIKRKVKTFKGRNYYIYLYEGEALKSEGIPRDEYGHELKEEHFKYLFQEVI